MTRPFASNGYSSNPHDGGDTAGCHDTGGGVIVHCQVLYSTIASLQKEKR